MSRSNADVHALATGPFHRGNVGEWCSLFHPTDSVYVDPVFGEIRTQPAIREWLVTVMRRAGSWSARGEGVAYFDGNLAFGEAVLSIDLAGELFPLPFCWVQRYDSGWIRYRRDYYDTASLRAKAPSEALVYRNQT